MAPPRIDRIALPALASVALLASPLAYAQRDAEALSPPFGSGGQVVLWGGSSIQAPFSPEIDYFIARNVSVGLDVTVSLYDYTTHDPDARQVEIRTTTVRAGPRLGANLPLGGAFSWFPRLTIGYESVHFEERLVSGQSLFVTDSPLGYPSTTQPGPYIFINAPVLFHPVEHFFVGFGPEFFHNLGSVSGGPDVGGQRTRFGASFVIGGYWGGDGPAAPEDEHKDVRPSRRFGDVHELVLTDANEASVHTTTYAGTQSSSFDASVAGAADYFVVDRVSPNGATGTAFADMLQLGLLVDWYPVSEDGWHVGSVVGLGGSSLVDASGSRSTSGGLAASLLGGYDWWIGPQWSLGALLAVSTATAGTMSAPGQQDTGYAFAPFAFALEISLLNH